LLHASAKHIISKQHLDQASAAYAVFVIKHPDDGASRSQHPGFRCRLWPVPVPHRVELDNMSKNMNAQATYTAFPLTPTLPR